MVVQMKKADEFSIVLLESSTNQIFLSYVNDDLRYSNFKKLLAETKPIEIIFC